MDSDMELKNCPFCGGSDIKIGKGIFGAFIECLACNANFDFYTTLTAVAEAWNTRANPDN